MCSALLHEVSESEHIETQQEARLPLVDTVETLGLLVGLGVALLGGPDELVAGTGVGGVFGVILTRLRGSLYTVQTNGRIKRKLRSPPDETMWTRLAKIEYDGKYDRLLAIGASWSVSEPSLRFR